MLNNIFNIRYNPRNNWKGQIQPMNGFCSFKCVEYGIRAAYITIRNYTKKGFTTLPQIIKRYAPSSENPTYDYIKYVQNGLLMKYPNFDCTKPINVKDKVFMVELLYNMMMFEGHKQSKHITRSFIHTTLNNFNWS